MSCRDYKYSRVGALLASLAGAALLCAPSARAQEAEPAPPQPPAQAETGADDQIRRQIQIGIGQQDADYIAGERDTLPYVDARLRMSGMQISFMNWVICVFCHLFWFIGDRSPKIANHTIYVIDRFYFAGDFLFQ